LSCLRIEVPLRSQPKIHAKVENLVIMGVVPRADFGENMREIEPEVLMCVAYLGASLNRKAQS
jgi:hypothetical protein